jgi:ABC-type transport system involved in multi-copper enzyme maturation permease subunit
MTPNQTTKKMKKKYLFATLPLIGVITVHLLMSYGNWDLNPSNWDEGWRMFSIIFMMLMIIIGIAAAATINDQ